MIFYSFAFSVKKYVTLQPAHHHCVSIYISCVIFRQFWRRFTSGGAMVIKREELERVPAALLDYYLS